MISNYVNAQKLSFLLIMTVLQACSGNNSNVGVSSSSLTSSSSSSTSNESVFGLWYDGERQVVEITNEALTVSAFDEYYKCVTNIVYTHTITGISGSNISAIGEDDEPSSFIATLSDKNLELTRSTADGTEYTNTFYPTQELYTRSCIDKQRSGELTVEVELTQLNEDFSDLMADDSVTFLNWYVAIKFDIDNSNDDSDGDLTLGIRGQKHPDVDPLLFPFSTISAANPTLAVKYGNVSLPVAHAKVEVTEKSLLLRVKYSDHPQANAITNATQVNVTAGFTLNDDTQLDYLPAFNTFTTGLDTSLIKDPQGDVTGLAGRTYDIISVQVSPSN